jgi:heme exporter protein B
MWLSTVWMVFRKDALLELRSRETLTAMATFGIMTLLLYNFALPLDGDRTGELAPGLLWVTVMFTAILGLGKTFAPERGNDVIDAIVSSPAPKPALFLGKLASNLLFIGLIELFLLPLFAVFFTVGPDARWGYMIGALALGTFGMATLGALFSAMTVTLKAREVIFPLLLLPLIAPVIIATAHALSAYVTGDIDAADPWMRLLAIADFIYLIASLWVFEFLVEE